MNNVKGTLFLKNFPLAPKMLLLTLIVGVAVWTVLDYIQTRKLQTLFDENMHRTLEQRAHDDRTGFDQHIAKYNRAARLIVYQKNFSDYVISHLSKPFTKLTYYSESPPWLPDASVMRYFIRIPYAVLIDGKGRVREIYINAPKPIPQALLAPSDLLRDLSHSESFMTNINEDPFLVTSESLNDEQGKPLGTLLIANILDDDFLSASQNMEAGDDIVALTDMGKGTIVASNRPAILIKGTPLESYRKDYLIIGKSFFDWGASDLLLQFSSFVSRADTVKMTASIIHAERLQRAILGGCLILAFAAVMYLITSHIKKLTHAITDFSRNALNLQPLAIPKGDQLLLLEDQFAQFTREIINSREQLKRQAEELLREKTVYLDNLLHSSAMAVIATDLDFRIKYFNPAAEKFFGYRAEDVIGKTVSEIKIAEKLDPPCFEKIAENVGKEMAHICTTKTKTPDGDLYLESRISLILDKDNKAGGFLLISNNITELKLAEKEMIELNLELQNHAAKLESAYKDLEIFSYAASHDLRSPLIPIEAFSRILLDDYSDKLDDKGRDLLGRIGKSARKMSRLIDDLLAFSRVSTGKFRKSEIDMEELTRSVYEELKTNIDQRTIRLNIKPMPAAYGDPSMLYQAVLNLLSNAIKFTRTRETAVIEVGGYSERDESIYYVQDNGIGFDLQYADKLFGLFQRIHISKDFEGTGIGLVIVKKIIEKHGGRVWAEGKSDEGAKFYFSLSKKTA